MKDQITVIWQTIKVFILFTGSTVLFYYGIMWLSEEYDNYHRYDEPNGAAIKVSALDEDGEGSWFDRIVLFYMNGE